MNPSTSPTRSPPIESLGLRHRRRGQRQHPRAPALPRPDCYSARVPARSWKLSHRPQDFHLFAPPSIRGGNGGGANDVIDPIRGRMPDRSAQTLTPPQVPVLDHPQLAITPTIAVPPDVKLPDNPALPNIGVYASTNVTLASNGPGGPTGIGWRGNGGDGPGDGWGPGSGPGVYTPGQAGVTEPVPLFTPEPEFSDEARRQKYQGVCLISLIVDSQGNPQAVHVTRALGMGLDEKALAAVQPYRFRPATKNGRPVPVRITVAVNFRLF